MTIAQLKKELYAKNIAVKEIWQSVKKRVNEIDPKVKAYITFMEEQNVVQNNNSALYGIPGAIKDNFCVKGIKTTCASEILSNFIPPYDAAVVAKLKNTGAPIIGKTNQDEFAMGSSTENSAFFITKNPWDLSRVPGGSSGGSAAAVAYGGAIWALGSDTGGSVRLPAAFCGVVGLKPTYGRVSRYGLVSYASSLDVVGTLTRDVYDAALLMNEVSFYDDKDSTSINRPKEDYTAKIDKGIKGFKIGIPKEYFDNGIPCEVGKAFEDAINIYKKLGAEIIDINMPNIKYALAIYYIISTAEASSNLARFDGVKYGKRVNGNNVTEMMKNTRNKGFCEEVKKRIMFGTYVLSSGYYDAYYLKALKIRHLIKRDFDEIFQKVDVLLTPVAPFVPFKIGEKIKDALAMYLTDVCTVTVNLAGIPALSLPCAYINGLPLGMQLIGKALDEAKLLRIGFSFERETGLANRIALNGGI